MKILKKITILITILLFIGSIQAKSVGERAKTKYTEIISYMMFLEVPMQNFGTDDQKERLSNQRLIFTRGIGFLYENDFQKSYRDFIEVQMGLEKLLEEFSQNYVNRTSELLNNANQEVMKLKITYNKRSQNALRFKRNLLMSRNPPEHRSYDDNKYHLYYDQFAMTNNIDIGFRKLGLAKKIRKDAMNIEHYLEKDKSLTPSMRKLRIEHYQSAIELCRESKQNAINIFKLLQRNDLYYLQKGKYSLTDESINAKVTTNKKDTKAKATDNFFVIEKNLSPIFDPRIPDEYKIDATDAFNRIYKEEICVKREMKDARTCNKELKSGKKG